MTDADAAVDAGNADAFDPIDFLETAVQHPSHENVDPMREFLCETLANQGIEPHVDDAGNVLANRGRAIEDAETHVVLNTHIDTVSPHVPFDRDADAPEADGAPVVRGRGSCDAKGPLAALLSAFFAVDPTDGRVTLAVTPDEEVLSTGAHAIVSSEQPPTRDADAVIVGEPTDLDVCTAAKGRFQGTIQLSGANAHAAEPDTGSNAVAALEPVLEAIRTFGERADAPPTHPQLGAATLTPTVVEGGEATNQVPADCALTVDRRSVPPETADDFHASLTAHLRAAVPDDVALAFRFTDRPTPFLEAWETDPDAAVVDILADASGGAVRPFTAATEASYFASAAPTVVFGPGVLADDEGAVAHAPREYVRVDAVRKAARALEATVTELLEDRSPPGSQS
ncbi:M20 family metallopeptidase [Natrinema pallidum]|uniref:Succinyl-diaminopimelate desuccinylase n=1 Tax=Natrinema pallidum DSM 3751 TaxID=1227495 RepID=L9YKY9_9EURY|nr:M20 family metallopeptidase [Natrinema pallidum]ELY74799.1 succinyl-diaminopimelate desuccinylase [Natrinema pallidum DSM 3751]